MTNQVQSATSKLEGTARTCTTNLGVSFDSYNQQLSAMETTASQSLDQKQRDAIAALETLQTRIQTTFNDLLSHMKEKFKDELTSATTSLQAESRAAIASLLTRSNSAIDNLQLSSASAIEKLLVESNSAIRKAQEEVHAQLAAAQQMIRERAGELLSETMRALEIEASSKEKQIEEQIRIGTKQALEALEGSSRLRDTLDWLERVDVDLKDTQRLVEKLRQSLLLLSSQR